MAENLAAIFLLLRSSPAICRIALAWPQVNRQVAPPPPGGEAWDQWAQVRFDFIELAYLADTNPKETIVGFDRLKALGIITPEGGLSPAAEKYFAKEGLAAVGIKAKVAKKKPEPEPGADDPPPLLN